MEAVHTPSMSKQAGCVCVCARMSQHCNSPLCSLPMNSQEQGCVLQLAGCSQCCARKSDPVAPCGLWETRCMLWTAFAAPSQLLGFQGGWEQMSAVCGFEEFLFLAFLRRLMAGEPSSALTPSCK